MNYEEAEHVIGPAEGGDHLIQPTEHAKAYSSNAPDMARLLAASDAKGIAGSFQQRDAEAVAARDKFKGIANWANGSVLLTAFSTGVVLATASLSSVIDASLANIGIPVVAFASAVAGAAAAGLLFLLRQGELLKRWMSGRAEAEAERLSYFKSVCRSKSGTGPSLQLLQLAYFNRFLIDTQMAWFERRGAEHQNSADRTLLMGAAAVGVGALSSFAAAGLSARGPSWASLAVLSIFGTAFASFAATRDTIHQDRRNTERYRSTAKTLSELKRKVPGIANDIQGGIEGALDGFVTVVCDVLTSENKQWMEETEKTKLALEDLEKLLADARTKTDERTRSAGVAMPDRQQP
jgi:hypothetical protein